MTICVDPLIKWSCGPSGSRLTRGKTCHLFVDDGNLEALHKLAASIGLLHDWFQNEDDDLPHYDLVESKRDLAIKMGAVEVDRRYIIRVRKAVASE